MLQDHVLPIFSGLYRFFFYHLRLVPSSLPVSASLLGYISSMLYFTGLYCSTSVSCHPTTLRPSGKKESIRLHIEMGE